MALQQLEEANETISKLGGSCIDIYDPEANKKKLKKRGERDQV